MILFLILIYLLMNHKEDAIRRLLQSIIVWTLFLMGLCYGWSLLHKLTAISLTVSYLLADLTLLVLVIVKKRISVKNIVEQVKKQRNWFGIASAIFLFILFAIVFRYAYNAVPYNWDSMTYHLPRIANWNQNQSVLPYASHIERQIASPVLGAYVNLFVYILGGQQDNLLNLLQCVSYGMNALLVYGTARKLGITSKIALLAPILYLCMPIALAEATTTQVDNYATMWLLAFLYLMMDLVDVNRELQWDAETRRTIAFAALSIALGYLAKPSICFGIVTFLVWLLIICIKRRTEIKVVLKYLVLAMPTILIVIVPSFLINAVAFGAVSHSGVGQRQLVGTLNPKYVLVNFLKNFTFNLASDQVETTRIWIEKFLYQISEWLKVDLNDPSISEDGRVFEFPGFPALNCDVALNMFLFVTAIILFIWFIFRIKKQSQLMRGFSIYAVSTYLIFCCFLRWEMYISRYMISYLALLTIFIAIQVCDMVKCIRSTAFCYGVYGILVFGSLVNYYNEIQYLRSIAPFSRPDGYFTYHGDVKDEYLPIMEEIAVLGDGSVGLAIYSDTYEYPIWAMLKDQDCEIRHIKVCNDLNKYELANYTPDYIIAEKYDVDDFSYHEYNYKLKTTGVNDRFRLYVKE